MDWSTSLKVDAPTSEVVMACSRPIAARERTSGEAKGMFDEAGAIWGNVPRQWLPLAGLITQEPVEMLVAT